MKSSKDICYHKLINNTYFCKRNPRNVSSKKAKYVGSAINCFHCKYIFDKEHESVFDLFPLGSTTCQ